MSCKDAHAFAASLAATLMVLIIVFQAGDGTFGAAPADEIVGGEVKVVTEVDPRAQGPRPRRGLRVGTKAPLRASRLSAVPSDGQNEPTMVGVACPPLCLPCRWIGDVLGECLGRARDHVFWDGCAVALLHLLREFAGLVLGAEGDRALDPDLIRNPHSELAHF